MSWLRLGLSLLGFVELSFQIVALLVGDLVGFLFGDFAELQQMFEIAVADRRAVFDRLVHERLREAGLVGFVVAPAAVAVHVDDDVALERRRGNPSPARPLGPPLADARR